MRKDLLSRLLLKDAASARVAAVPKKYQVKTVTAFACQSCGDLHHGEDDAMECCDPEEISAYECGRCDSLYRTKDRAESCCRNRKLTQSEASEMEAAENRALRAVECPVCGDSYGKEGSDEGNEGWPYAARCCLGADLSPAQTWELARLVRYGQLDWTEAIDRVAGGAS
jgi:hypothetical protein